MNWDLLCHKVSLYEIAPYAWSVIIKVIFYFFADKYYLSVTRNLDPVTATSDMDDPILIERSQVASEASTRFSLFMTLLTSGLTTILIAYKNNNETLGILAALITFSLALAFYLLDTTKTNTKYFTEEGRKSLFILFIFIFFDAFLFSISYFSAPACKP